MAEKLDINRASTAQIEKISGISRTMARKIVKARNSRGGFSNFEELRGTIDADDRLMKALVGAATLGAPAASSPESAQAQINLDPDGGDRGRYAGYRANLDYQSRISIDDQDSTVVAAARIGYFDADGALALGVPEPKSIVGPLKLSVREPGGSIVAAHDFAVADLAKPILLPVQPVTPPTTRPTDAPTFGQPQRLRGRVLDRSGRTQVSGSQVIVFAATEDDPADDDFVPLATARTDASGYFSTNYPLGQFTSAHATVALERTLAAVPIHLGDDGALPGDVILIVDAPTPGLDDRGDCACGSKAAAVLRNPDAEDLVNSGFSADIGQGKCVDFTRPDRSLQEFSYSYVVRTTEPTIEGMTLQDPPKVSPGLWKEIISLASLNAAQANFDNAAVMAMRSSAGAGAAAEFNPDATLALRVLDKPEKIAPLTLQHLAFASKYRDLTRAIGKLGTFTPERSRMDCRHAVDWDFEPTIYQACTIAHGHLLHFKQEWIADGYSMGRLLYSLPLAPGQKKQIAVLDWERRESAAREESTEEAESLTATLSRDRDIGEMVNSVLAESSRGGSSASTSAFGGGLGIGAILGPVGGLLGIGGGASNANSNAWQNSSRNVAANSLQTLRDRTSQAASAMRAQRSTVVQTIAQGERVSVTTESVANYNHCHAMTVEYFEVLRHLMVRQRLVDVQECLFVPLQMSRFDRAKALRWLNTLQPVMPTRDLRAGFDALERIDNNYVGSNLPVGRYADQPLDYVEGDLQLRFQLARPRDKDEDFDPVNWGWLAKLIPSLSAEEQYKTYLKDQQFKDRIFLEQFGPRIARAFVDLLQLSWMDENDTPHSLPIDPTLLSNFVNDRVLSVSLRMADALNGIARKSIKFVEIHERVLLGGILTPLFQVLPASSRVIVEGGSMSYRTQFSSGYLFRSGNIRNDLTGSDAVRIYTPLDAQELRNPREEDKERARRLLDHLNENIERYHHALWWRMSPDRRYMLLDGFEAPGSNGRSVASVVENHLIGIVGNSLIMPVAPGFHLDPTYKQDVEDPIDLLEHYQPNTPIEPVRVAIPTRGVYAEAVMGACNSCEVKEEERFWRWEESPIPDNPPAILPTSTDTRRAEPGNLQAKDFPAPIIAMQSAPAAPDPTGLAAALKVLATPDLFKDITGLDANQRNALQALQASLSTAQAFGDKAANLALQGKMSKDIDRTMRTISSAKEQGLINDEQASALTQGAIQSMIGAGPTTDPKPLGTKDVKEITQTAGANSAAVKVSRPSGEQVSVDARPDAKDGPRPLIVLDTDTAAPERRAFDPATDSLTGEASLAFSVRNAPGGHTVKWTPGDAAALDVATPTAEATVIRAKRPGKTHLDIVVSDGGAQLATTRLAICVPQFVTIDEDVAKFKGVLAELKIDGRKDDVLREARTTCVHLLQTANVRTVWRMAPFSESVPAHIDAALVTTATIKGEPSAADSNLFGVTHSSASGMGAASFNETIELFPGAYDNPVAGGSENMVDTESQAILMQIQSDASPSADLLDFAVKVFGRMIGETLAHEIVHSLLGTQVAPNFHNSPAIPNDLMNPGFDRSFRQRTGIEDTALTSPVIPSNFIDHGVSAIGGLQSRNQGLIDAVFPVPPAFA